jgi:hypothetical protein
MSDYAITFARVSLDGVLAALLSSYFPDLENSLLNWPELF